MVFRAERRQEAYSTALRGPRGTLFALHVHLRYRETPEGGWVPEALFVVSRAVNRVQGSGLKVKGVELRV